MIRTGLLVAAVLAAAAASICHAQTAASVAPGELAGKQRQLNIDSFEYVWTTVRDKHWQAKPAGLDWQAVHDELRPVIEKSSTMEAARGVLNDMLGRLHETHFAIIPSDLYSDLDGSSAKGEVATGMDVRMAGPDVLVTSVEAGSSSAREGVQPGWQILKIGSIDLGPVMEKLNQTYARSTLRELILREAILSRLGSKPGEPVAVEFLDGANQRITKSLAQGKPRGALSQFGFLYPMHVWFDSSKVANGVVGFVKFNIFLDPAHVMNRFGEAVEGCKTCQGFIIDLRGNPGGIGAMAMGMAGWFIEQPDQRLGTLYMRDTTLKFVVNPRVYTFAGPLAILVDGASASTSEILAGGLKDLGRARIFGTRTAAAALPSVFEMLPNGDGFQYAIANYISEGGKPLEGLGVTPDVEAPITREALLAGKDPALDAAIAWIKNQRP
jgi:carboxyl-terminal processing protease